MNPCHKTMLCGRGCPEVAQTRFEQAKNSQENVSPEYDEILSCENQVHDNCHDAARNIYCA